MRQFLYGLFGVAALGFGALTAEPASALPFGPGPSDHGSSVVDTVQYYGPPRGPYGRWHRPPPPPRYGYYGRPYRPVARCWTRPERFWNGYRWVVRPVRICR
ncbi:hypothetical protein [Microvirga rosea]|uniref:hypothetical protein n=1 Tax=Microvirga rosea TaxID=2715425 RepID=UPI001D0A7BCE|nr:hypothetical protein [Microvirga rosea]MCB8820300.1 hypothetical protein [Microvirga rosea]